MSRATIEHTSQPPAKPLTRRLFFKMSGAGAAAAAAAALPATVVALPITENPEIIAIGQRLASAIATLSPARTAMKEARAHFDRIAPAVLEELLITRNFPMWAGCYEEEVDCVGKRIIPPNIILDGKKYAVRSRYLIKGDLLRGAIERGNLYASKRTKFGRQVHRLIALSDQYEVARNAAIEAAGITNALNALYDACDALMRIAVDVTKEQARTMKGIVIKAQIINHIHSGDYDDRHQAIWVMPGLVSDVLAFAAAQASEA